MRPAFARPVLPVLLALALCSCQADEEKLEQHLSRAQDYAEAERWSEAIIEYKNVLQIDPNRGDVHFGLSQAYLKNRQPREAYWELRETVRLDPANLRAKLQFGQISVYAGELEEALKQAEDVIGADETKIDAHLLKAQALDALKRGDEALATYQRAVEIAPENRFALMNLGNYHRRRREPEAAEPVYRRLLEVAPDSASYTLLASFLSQDRGRDPEAEAAFRKALEVSQTSEERSASHVRVAGFLFGRDRFDEAIQSLENAIEDTKQRGEDPLDLIYLLARFYLNLGDSERADALIENATAASPDNPRPYLVLSSYRGRRGDKKGSLEAARKALELDPTDESAKLRTAEVLVEVGHEEKSTDMIAEGRSIVDAMLATEPSNPGALFVRAKAEMAEQRVDAAVGTLRAAIDGRPDWAQPHFVLGAALAIQGDYPAARSELARSLEIDAGLLEAHKVLAQVHYALREWDYTIESGRRYLREKPNDTETRILVAQALVLMGDSENALRELEAIRGEDRDAEVLYAFGRIHFNRKEYDPAREALVAADAAKPRDPEILAMLLRVDQVENRVPESVERINAAAQAEPENAALQRLRGVVSLEAGRPSDAERSLQKALELDPNDLQNYEALARFYGLTGRTEQTIRTYEKALEVRPEAGPVHHFLGVLYEYGGQRDLAVKRYEDAIRYAPNLAESKNNLAYLLAEAGEDLDRALDLAQDAKASLPENPNAADTLGWVLYKRGIPSAAISYLKEAETGMNAGDPGLGVVRHHLALAYEANGELEPARETLERALAEHRAQIEALEAQGGVAGADPEWAVQARAMLDRLPRAARSAPETPAES